MSKPWLTEELDKTPYTYRVEELEDITKTIENEREKIEDYFSVHPNARKAIFPSQSRTERYRKNALTYLGIESGETLDIKPFALQTDEERFKEKIIADKLEGYIAACRFAHECAKGLHRNLESNPIDLYVRIHWELLRGDPDRVLIRKQRLRNEEDGTIIVGNGCFNPVEGKMVLSRTNNLSADYEFVWNNENLYAKLAKFITEYIRIQPHMDGNKRAALVIMNYYLEKEKMEDIYFTKDQVDYLYDLINKAIISRDVTDVAKHIASIEKIRYDAIIERIRDYRLTKLNSNNYNTDESAPSV